MHFIVLCQNRICSDFHIGLSVKLGSGFGRHDPIRKRRPAIHVYTRNTSRWIYEQSFERGVSKYLTHRKGSHIWQGQYEATLQSYREKIMKYWCWNVKLKTKDSLLVLSNNQHLIIKRDTHITIHFSLQFQRIISMITKSTLSKDIYIYLCLMYFF